jgi:periplasmic protein TonB
LDTSINDSSFKKSTIIWAIVCSILLHVLLVAVIPKLTFDTPKKVVQVIKVELVQPKKPEPIPEKIELLVPEKIKPEPVKPEPIKPKETKPKEIKPEPIQKVVEPNPAPVVDIIKPEPAPKQEAKPAPAEPQVSAVIAVEPKPAESKPEEKLVFVAPTPQPEPKPEPASGEDVGAAKSAYAQNIAKELKRNLRYPKIATMRGIQGVVKVAIKFDDEGNVISTSIVESSGSDLLDEGALATVARSSFKQYMKKVLVGQIDTITVPIAFTLANP